MTVMLLIRHGATQATGKRLYGRGPGIYLSEEGRSQADALARRLETFPLAAVYSSPLERCIETATPIAERHGLTVETVDGLLETDVGRWTGRTFASISRTRLWRQVRWLPSAVRFPDGESLADTQRRMVGALERIEERHPGAAVAVVSHGDPIELALAHYAGLHLDMFQRLDVTPGSVSAVEVGRGAPRLRRLNDTGTLADLAPPARTRRR